MTIDVLATGSTGNAVVINGEILVDIGVPYKTLEQSGYIPKLKLVLLTHCHSDHFNPRTVGRLHESRPALRWGMCEWMVTSALKAGIYPFLIDEISPSEPAETRKALVYSDFTIISAVPLIHDVLNCGWDIQIGREHLFYATDTGTLDHVKAEGFDYYLIEANHSKVDIEARIKEKQARGEFAYEFRAARNHLSQEQALDWLSRNMGPNSKVVWLHQHKDHKEEHNETD